MEEQEREVKTVSGPMDIEVVRYFRDLLKDKLMTYKDFEKILNDSLEQPFEEDNIFSDAEIWDEYIETKYEKLVDDCIAKNVTEYYDENRTYDINKDIYRDDAIRKMRFCKNELLSTWGE